MAAPIIGKNIAITVTNGNENETVQAYNLTRNSKPVSGKLNSSQELVLNTADTGTEWLSGDLVQVQITGRINDSSEFTLGSGGKRVTLSGSADTSTPAVDL